MKNKKLVNLIYLFNIILCFYFFAYVIVNGISGNDFFWHVKTGEWIATNKQIPKLDIFSWIGTGVYDWTAHEWLSDLLYFVVYDFLGEKAIVVLAILFLSLSHLLLMKCTEDKWSKYPLVAFFWFLYNIVTFSTILQCRPYVFSFIFLNLELYLLNRFMKDKSFKGIYFIPLIALLWINMHGGSANLSYLIILMFLIPGILPKFNFHKLKNERLETKDIKKLSIVGLVTILANCINPYGFHLVAYPYTYTGGDRFDLKVIMEWQAIDLKTMLGLIFIIGLVLLTICLLISKKEISITNFLLFGAFAYLMLKSIRFEFLFFIVATYIIFDYIPEEINKIGEEKFLKAMILIFSICIFVLNCFVMIINDHTYIKTQLDKEVINIIKESENKRLFNFYDYGEELIFNEIPVFVDSRADNYSYNGNVLQESWALWMLDNSYLEEYNKVLDVDYYFDELYNFDSVLIPSYIPLNIYLEGREDFKITYSNNDVVYWERID